MLQSSIILSQKKEHNVEQKCSVALLSSALTPISLWTVSWKERGVRGTRKNSVGNTSLPFFFFNLHSNISGINYKYLKESNLFTSFRLLLHFVSFAFPDSSLALTS